MRTLIKQQLDTIVKHEDSRFEAAAATLQGRQRLRKRVLGFYSAGDLTLVQISKMHGVPPPTITVWAKQEGLPPRKRGRRIMAVPCLQMQQALRSLETQTYEQLASKLWVSRARVGQVVSRWRPWIKDNNLRIGRDRIKPRKLPQLRQRREPKVSVVSFRLTEQQVKKLVNSPSPKPPTNVRSIHQLARALLLRTLGASVTCATHQMEVSTT